MSKEVSSGPARPTGTHRPVAKSIFSITKALIGFPPEREDLKSNSDIVIHVLRHVRSCCVHFTIIIRFLPRHLCTTLRDIRNLLIIKRS